MREQRWETTETLSFSEVLALGERLALLGLSPAGPNKDLICYIEEWIVEAIDDLDKLDPWPSEDVTLVRIQDRWQGDFFLLAGNYHTVYQRFQNLGTYCSISHPWCLPPLLTHFHDRAMVWLGFRHSHGFVRLRLETSEVIAPGEGADEGRRTQWLEERRQVFFEAINLLELPVETSLKNKAVFLTSLEPKVPFFCSWPDDFGPCQFEFNTSDPYEFLVPATRLISSCGGRPSLVRAYFTGFSEKALQDLCEVQPEAHSAYRCSIHCPLDELPEVRRAIEPSGRLYATLCEFQTTELKPDGHEASAIIGVMGTEEGFRLEIRLNRIPIPQTEMAPWLNQVIGHEFRYAPLSAFP